LNLAWDLLSLLPPDTLSRVSEDELRKYHHYAPDMAGEPA
jgi:V/A-type H+-transporting ATPase subunit B